MDRYLLGNPNRHIAPGNRLPRCPSTQTKRIEGIELPLGMFVVKFFSLCVIVLMTGPSFGVLWLNQTIYIPET